MRFLGVVALLGAVGAARKEEEADLLFPANWKPHGLAASIIDVEKHKTTFSLECQPTATADCSVYLGTMTQGPSTWIYGGEWNNIAGVDQYTLNNACKVEMDADEMTCTLAVTQVKDDKTLSTVRTDTTEGLSDYMYPIPITSATHHPKPTKTEPSTTKEATSSSEPKPTSTSSVHSEHTKPKDKPSHTLITTTELVFVAPDPTQIAITEPSTTTADSSSSAYTPTVVTPSAPGSNAGPAPTRNAMLLGAAAVVGGALIF